MNGVYWLFDGLPAARVAIECPGVAAEVERVTYGELCERVARAAGLWLERGLTPGTPVAVKLPDGIDWVVAWLGVLWAGGVAVGVDPRVPADEWRMMLEEARFGLIVAEDKPGQDAHAAWHTRTVSLAEARSAWRGATPCPPVPRDDAAPAFWVYSSGSSGRPKAVVHAHRALRSIADVSKQRLGLTPADRLYASSRLFFTYPLVNVLLAGLRIGATVLLDSAWPNAATLPATLRRLAPSAFFSVPSLYRDLLRQGHAANVRDAGVRLCVSAGEALPGPLRRAWREASGLPIIDGYGTSETLVLVLTDAGAEVNNEINAKAVADPKNAADAPTALTPSPGVDAEPLEAQAAAVGEPTRLVLRAPTLALGYHDRPTAQAESFVAADAFCPADLFIRVGARHWRFAGRDDALFKVRGRWVDLADLDQQLMSEVQELREAATARVTDADGLDAVALFFVADDPTRARAQLQERIAAWPPHQRPVSLQALPALPRTATGKLLRRELTALAADAASRCTQTASLPTVLAP